MHSVDVNAKLHVIKYDLFSTHKYIAFCQPYLSWTNGLGSRVIPFANTDYLHENEQRCSNSVNTPFICAYNLQQTFKMFIILTLVIN